MATALERGMKGVAFAKLVCRLSSTHEIDFNDACFVVVGRLSSGGELSPPQQLPTRFIDELRRWRLANGVNSGCRWRENEIKVSRKSI
jgi:hypothetical protein